MIHTLFLTFNSVFGTHFFNIGGEISQNNDNEIYKFWEYSGIETRLNY